MRKLHVLFVVLLLLWHNTTIFAQVREISGRIKDPGGVSIPNATIRIEGSKKGTSSNEDGFFRITVTGQARLLITAIGFESKSIVAGWDMNNINIQLNIDARSLTEVVVTGAGTATSKKKLGISVESVSASQLPAAPTASIDQALIGKIPGAQISSISGNPGDPVNILLRGINSIQGGTQPLIMLDGVQVRTTDINSLDLSMIDRVEVVQGAASASLYGAQGANGVIQLFTKKGRPGAASINYFTSYAINTYINNGHVNKASLHPYLTDANNNIVDANGNPDTYDQYGDVEYVAYANGGATRYAIINPLNINDKPYNANLKFYDHFKQVFQQGSSLNNGINISGASDKIDYAFSASDNHTVTPVMQTGYLDRSNFTANVGAELFKGFRVRSITQLIYTRNTMTPLLGGGGGPLYGYGNQAANVSGVFNWLNTSPFYDLKYKLADGTHPAIQETGGYLGANAFNPFYTQEYSSNIDNRIDILQDFDADYKVNKFVELDAKYGIQYRNENAKWTFLNQSTNINSNYFDSWQDYWNGNDNGGEIDNWQYNNTFQNFLTTAYFRTDWQKDFQSKLPITTSTQLEYDYRKTKYTELESYGLDLPLVPPINMSSTQTQYVAPTNPAAGQYGDYVEPFITYGYLVNQVIDYGDYGGIAGGFRSDYSSTFGEGSKPFTFPHANAYIVPSSFKFWEDGVGNTLSFFKIRGAYGQAGIQPGAFARYPVVNGQDLGSSVAYSIPSTANNPNLSVQVSTEIEAGADLSITANKRGDWFRTINGSATYWHRKSSNVIYTLNTAPSDGVSGELTNDITLHSQGIQFQLELPVYKSRNFLWDFTTNFGHQVSILDKIQGGQPILQTSAGGTAEVLYPGAKIGQIDGYKALTSVTEKNQEGVPYITPTEYANYTMVDGRVVNIATKAIQFTNETYPLGDPNPKFNSSFINSFGYKDIVTLSFQLDWVYGSHLYNQTKEWMYRDGIHKDFSTPVDIAGTTAAYTAYRASAYYALGAGDSFSAYGSGNDAAKDYFYESSSFLRLRNVSVGFDIAKIARLRYLKKCQLVLTGRNIFTKTKYTGMDPEISSGTPNSAWDRGVDQSTIPNVKSYQVGLNVGF